MVLSTHRGSTLRTICRQEHEVHFKKHVSSPAVTPEDWSSYCAGLANPTYLSILVAYWSYWKRRWRKRSPSWIPKGPEYLDIIEAGEVATRNCPAAVTNHINQRLQ